MPWRFMGFLRNSSTHTTRLKQWKKAASVTLSRSNTRGRVPSINRREGMRKIFYIYIFYTSNGTFEKLLWFILRYNLGRAWGNIKMCETYMFFMAVSFNFSFFRLWCLRVYKVDTNVSENFMFIVEDGRNKLLRMLVYIYQNTQHHLRIR